MTVTWRGAVRYALTVTVLSWLTGAVVDFVWQASSGSIDTWLSNWPRNPASWVFVAAATAVLTLSRRLSDPMPMWRVPLIDGSAYLLVLLLCAGLSAWASGDEAPADSAFVVAILAMFTFQLPSAWLLSVWRSRHLETVLTSGAVARASWPAGR